MKIIGKYLRQKLVGVAIGATLGAMAGWLSLRDYSFATGAIAGAVCGGCFAGGRIGKTGWALLGCSVLGAMIGGVVGVIIDNAKPYGPESPLREGMKLQFRSEFFNVLNRVNLGSPNVTVGSSMGRITSAGSARVLQFALKVLF